MTALAQANRLLRNGDYPHAVGAYIRLLQTMPRLGKIVVGNLDIARQKWRMQRAADQRLKVAVCGWDLSLHVAERVSTLAGLYRPLGEVEIIGSRFPDGGREICSSVRTSALPCHSFVVESPSRFVLQALELVTAHPYDVIHLSGPRFPNILFGLLYKLVWGATVFMDMEDEKPALESPHPADQLKKKGELPNFENLTGREWTRLAVESAGAFDGVTSPGSDTQGLRKALEAAREHACKPMRGPAGSTISPALLSLVQRLEPLALFRPLIDYPKQASGKGKPGPAVLKALASSPETCHSGGMELLNILFVLYGSIESNGGLHARLHAARLEAQGFICRFAVPYVGGGPKATSTEGGAGRGPSLIAHRSLFEGEGFIPPCDIIHAWTPRENVRKVCEKLLERCRCPLVVHLEDNEEYLTEAMVGRPFDDLARLSDSELDELIFTHTYHPRKGRAFLDRADGLTLIADSLGRFNTRGVPTLVLPAPVDEGLFYPRPLNVALRQKLNIPVGHVVLAYTGNVHAANGAEVYELYKAVRLLNERGLPTVLLRTGQGCPTVLSGDGQGKKRSGGDPRDLCHVKSLGIVERVCLPGILAAADILVQPGMPGPFNDQRVPSKLPEYFAMGRPVILPRTNLGIEVRHERDGYVLDKADAEGIVGAVKKIMDDGVLRESLGRQAAAFYRESLRLREQDKTLHDYYRSLLPARRLGMVPV